jgi:hypothetical protein
VKINLNRVPTPSEWKAPKWRAPDWDSQERERRTTWIVALWTKDGPRRKATKEAAMKTKKRAPVRRTMRITMTTKSIKMVTLLSFPAGRRRAVAESEKRLLPK